MAEPISRMTCDHPDVAVQAGTNRVSLPGGAIAAWVLALSAKCNMCGASFWFPGLPTGVSYLEPVTTTDGFQINIPMVPENRRNTPDPSLASTMVRTSDMMKGHKAP